MIYEVKKPILGFEDVLEVELKEFDKHFSVIEPKDKDFPTFTLINPYSIIEYSFVIPKDVEILLDINETSEVLVYNIVVLNNPITKSVVNFKAPLIFNKSNGTMAQFILKDAGYLTIEECLAYKEDQKKEA